MAKTLKDYRRTTPSLHGENPESKRVEILDYFLTTFELFEKLFDPLKDKTVFYQSPEPTRHPIIFYYGHTAAFFINKLIIAKVIETRINPELEAMFAIGVDEMKWDDLDHPVYEWASVETVKAYRAEVKSLITSLILSQPLRLPISWEDSFWWTILMGCEHERIHLETSSVLHRQLPIEAVSADPFWTRSDEGTQNFPQNSLIEVEESTVTYGKESHDDFYGWDNEYGSESIELESFKASKYLVSNGEFLEFVTDMGYETERYWDAEGWQWLAKEGRKHPYFWVKAGETFKLRTMLEVIEMPYNFPVEVNALEAQAFCRYKSEKTKQNLTLLSEAQWYVLAQKAGLGTFLEGNIDLKIASSTPVDAYKQGDFYDISGNVWQWTSTPIYPFEGFRVHPVYDDFSVPTFDQKHNLIKGGSWISTGNELLKSARYAFRRHFIQHAGFRYVQAKQTTAETQESNSYETDTQVAQYCDFHYGEEHFGVKNLALALTEIALSYQDSKLHKKVLDLGCAVGRMSFELAKHFESVTGIDFSARFIQVGTQLQDEGRLSYRRVIEGDIGVIETVDLKSLGYDEVAHKVTFMQGDACNLKPIFSDYDLIIASNLIDRLYEPKRFLESMKARLNRGGLLILSSPYTWLEEFTLKEHWLGGVMKEGEAFTTLDGLKAFLGTDFELVDTPKDLPFVIRETARKFQHTIAQVTVWKRK